MKIIGIIPEHQGGPRQVLGMTHWIDLSELKIPLEANHKRFWADENEFPIDKPYRPKTESMKKKTFWQKIFG